MTGAEPGLAEFRSQVESRSNQRQNNIIQYGCEAVQGVSVRETARLLLGGGGYQHDDGQRALVECAHCVCNCVKILSAHLLVLGQGLKVSMILRKCQ